ELARQAFGRGEMDVARKYAEEAGETYRKIALTPWDRRPMAIGLFAVEEYNVFRAWAEAQEWECAPELPSLGEDLEGVLACDVRVTLAWDADETDVDLHVTEPTGEEAYYAHNLTHDGGRVSEDITDGYGPELYEIRKAREGVYRVRAHYFASHQQTVFGPATCTLTVYTDWGRPAQTRRITSVRLDRKHEMVSVGEVTYCQESTREASSEPVRCARDEGRRPGAERIEVGMSTREVMGILGGPVHAERRGEDERWTWDLPGGRNLVVEFSRGGVTRVVESMSWGDEMVILQ
ncbi:MAG: DUF2135 domain-containing protein, partial [Coriobacteriales bacterium]|nr:DUF2135 domain-containing protein [Coriobacteriales bacterium]